MKKLYLVAGEVSGDAHGSGMMRALREISTDLEFRGAGGPQMRGVVGAEKLVNWIDEAGVLGLWEVLKKYGYFKRKFNRMLAEVDAWKPDALILIDYPGFNLRFARALRRKRRDLKIVYFISPQVWAWNRKRIPRMAKLLDRMLCIFPFEKELYEASGLRTEFVGHPMIDRLGPEKGGGEREDSLVGLFPGSRGREVEKLFPAMLEAAVIVKKRAPQARFIAAAASDALANAMGLLAENAPLPGDFECEIVTGRAHELMQRATCGVIASGTATLEAAFFGLPYCLVYKVSTPTYLAAKAVIRVDHLGIINILAGRELVREFLQGAVTPDAIAGELTRLLESDESRSEMSRSLEATVAQLGEGGACAKAARAVWEALS